MKLALGILASVLLSTSGFAEPAPVAFANTGSHDYRLWVGTPTNLMTGANAYRIGLYIAPGAGQPEVSLQLVGLATNTALPVLAGYFNGGNPFYLPAPYDVGNQITFQIRAWSFGSGASYEQAVPDPFAVLGKSALGYGTLGSVPLQLFGTGPGQIGAFGIGVPIPEPATWALALVGATIGLVVVRGRKRINSR